MGDHTSTICEEAVPVVTRAEGRGGLAEGPISTFAIAKLATLGCLTADALLNEGLCLVLQLHAQVIEIFGVRYIPSSHLYASDEKH